jgi:valacyclovir hydrolase
MLQALSIGRFSMLGWSDGGITAMIAAAKYPEQIDKLVIWGANAYIVDQEAKIYESEFCLSNT